MHSIFVRNQTFGKAQISVLSTTEDFKDGCSLHRAGTSVPDLSIHHGFHTQTLLSSSYHVVSTRSVRKVLLVDYFGQHYQHLGQLSIDLLEANLLINPHL